MSTIVGTVHSNCLQDIGDVYFFSHAMEVCCYYLQDIELAERLNGLFNKTENEVFRGDSNRRQNY